jgi:DNA-binding GntR family transcriptional regulator
MSIEALNWCKSQPCPTPTSKLVLFVLSNYADERHSCYPSEKHLAKICGISDRSVRRCITALSELGLLDIESRKGTSNRYHLRVDTSVQSRVDTSVRTVRPRASAYTKEKQKKKTQRRSLNELAG